MKFECIDSGNGYKEGFAVPEKGKIYEVSEVKSIGKTYNGIDQWIEIPEIAGCVHHISLFRQVIEVTPDSLKIVKSNKGKKNK